MEIFAFWGRAMDIAKLAVEVPLGCNRDVGCKKHHHVKQSQGKGKRGWVYAARPDMVY